MKLNAVHLQAVCRFFSRYGSRCILIAFACVSDGFLLLLLFRFVSFCVVFLFDFYEYYVFSLRFTYELVGNQQLIVVWNTNQFAGCIISIWMCNVISGVRARIGSSVDIFPLCSFWLSLQFKLEWIFCFFYSSYVRLFISSLNFYCFFFLLRFGNEAFVNFWTGISD